MYLRATLVSIALLVNSSILCGQWPVRAGVHFDRPLRVWDGFGVNYVEAAQTRDYKADPQEYGGFSLLKEEERQAVVELVFGEDGLKPGLLKMFQDSWMEPENDNNDPNVIDLGRFDHETSTRWMRYFAREGLKRTRARGDDLQVIVTLYGPPAWTTKQKFVRGRDVDPAMKEEVAEYMISWAKYLREKEGLPVKWISLHNEGEDFVRWPKDGSTWDRLSHDYNMYWPPEQVVEFLPLMRSMLDRQGMRDVGVTPGETTNWFRFNDWGYAGAIVNDDKALRTLGLITAHGFVSLAEDKRWFGDWRMAGVQRIRDKRPELHAWVTSQSWAKMDVAFVNQIRDNIYATGVNGVIPWAAIQRPEKWVGGDPNPGSAFYVYEDGRYEVRPGYHYYKQISRAGQPGMAVADVFCTETVVRLMAFSSNGTRNRDSFVVYNLGTDPVEIAVEIKGTAVTQFDAFRTGPEEAYKPLGEMQVRNGVIPYTVPPRTVTTFFGK
ncbi:MAG: hypothetical protein KIT83_03840 [Bryobacterales bacterium]|nr:hypothetical protein [Bryobacterales bacterium]